MGLFNWLFGRRARPAKHPVAPASAETTVSYGAPAFAVVDVETTGLSPQRDRVLEVAIVRLDATGAVVDEWVTRIDPEGPVGAIHIHGIRQADVVGRPRFADVAGTIVARLSGLAVVAHNAKFDLAFLRNELKSAGWDVPWIAAYCTLDASYAYLPDMDRRRLADCCWAVGVRLDDAHSALGDARAAAGLLGAYVGLNGGPDPVLTEAQDLARSTRWPSGPSRSPSRSASASVAGPRAGRMPASGRPARITSPRPTAPPLLEQLTAMSLLEVLEEGAPVGSTAYLEMLFDALEDGDISDAESVALQELCAEYELSPADTSAAHEAFLLALAHRAVDDGRVSHDERRELRTIASLLGVAETKVKRVLDRADAARHARLSAGLGALPAPWPHGEPLRVGDKVVFTGCDERQRARLEQRSEEARRSGRRCSVSADGHAGHGRVLLRREVRQGDRTRHASRAPGHVRGVVAAPPARSVQLGDGHREGLAQPGLDIRPAERSVSVGRPSVGSLGRARSGRPRSTPEARVRRLRGSPLKGFTHPGQLEHLGVPGGCLGRTEGAQRCSRTVELARSRR